MDHLSALTRLDLNLLTVFRALDEVRHVTRAAKILHVSQPALSHALRRLRDTFDDPLFIKTPRGMVLTPLAEALAQPVREVLTRIERDILERGSFRPEAIVRTFRVRTTDLLESLFIPTLLTTLEAQAPNARISVLPAGFGLPKTELETGTCDLAIAGFFGEMPDGFYQKRLFSDSFHCAVRRDHPRIRPGKVISLDEYCGEPHMLIAPGGELTGVVDRALRRHKRARRIVAGTSGFTVAGWITAQSDCILTAPSRLITMFARYLPLSVFAPPLALPELKIAQVWHARSHDDPAHRWFRALVHKALT